MLDRTIWFILDELEDFLPEPPKLEKGSLHAKTYPQYSLPHR